MDKDIREKISKAKKGKSSSKKGKKYGPISVPSKTKGKKHFNNGTISIMSDICPDGFVPGRIMTRNGKICKTGITKQCQSEHIQFPYKSKEWKIEFGKIMKISHARLSVKQKCSEAGKKKKKIKEDLYENK